MGRVGEVRKPRTRITAAEVTEQIEQLRGEFRDSIEFYHQQVLVPHLRRVVRAVGAQQSIFKRIRSWVRMLWVRFQLRRMVKKFKTREIAAAKTQATLPLVTAMRVKPSQRAHHARQGAPRALCGVEVDHRRPVPEDIRVCVTCKRAKSQIEQREQLETAVGKEKD